MDKYLAASAVLAIVSVMLITFGIVFSINDADDASSFETSEYTIHCKTVFEENGAPFPGVMIYARGSAITDARGECTITAEGDGFVRLIVYPPHRPQKIITIPVSAGESEVNVIIPI